MTAFRRDNKWRYRRVVKLPDGSGQRIYGTPTRNTRAAAEQAERQHIERLLNPPPTAKAKAQTLGVFSVEFMATYVAANNKPSEQKAKRLILDRHILPVFGPMPMDEIGTREIEAFKAELIRDNARSRKTANNVLCVLGKLLRYAKEVGELDTVPTVRLLKVDKQDFCFLEVEDYGALLKVASRESEWHLAVLLGGDAGLRMGEIRALQWGDWNRRADKLTVTRAMWRDQVGSTKGWNKRTIPLTKRLAAALRKHRHLRGDFVLCDENREPLSMETMRWHLPRLCNRAGISPIGWHALRHTFCSHLAMKGAPARVIQELAGHASLTTTDRYMHLVSGATDQAIALLDQPWHCGGTGSHADAKNPATS